MSRIFQIEFERDRSREKSLNEEAARVRARQLSKLAGEAFTAGEPCPMELVYGLQDEGVREAVASNSISCLPDATYNEKTRERATNQFRKMVKKEKYQLRQRHNAMIQLWNLRADAFVVAVFILQTDPHDFIVASIALHLEKKYLEILAEIQSSFPKIFSDAVREVKNGANKKRRENCRKILARLENYKKKVPISPDK